MFSPFTSRASAAESEAGMETEAAPKKRRLTAFGKKARRERIFARLREGWAYDEIARQEGLTAARVRQIVAEVLHRRQIDHNTAHALLQLARLGPAVQLVGEAVARGDVQAVWPLLGVLDRLDRYHKVARAIQRDNEETRAKLFDRLTRLARAAQRKSGSEEDEAAPEDDGPQAATAPTDPAPADRGDAWAGLFANP